MFPTYTNNHIIDNTCLFFGFGGFDYHSFITEFADVSDKNSILIKYMWQIVCPRPEYLIASFLMLYMVKHINCGIRQRTLITYCIHILYQIVGEKIDDTHPFLSQCAENVDYPFLKTLLIKTNKSPLAWIPLNIIYHAVDDNTKFKRQFLDAIKYIH